MGRLSQRVGWLQVLRRAGSGLFALALAGAVVYGLWRSGTWLEGWWPAGRAAVGNVLRWLPTMMAGWLIAIAGLYRLTRYWQVQSGAGKLPALPDRTGDLDVTVGYVGRRAIVVPHSDRFLHTLVVGTTGTGKTSRLLKPMIWQDLKALARGSEVGLTVIEPKGDLVSDVAAMCAALGTPYVLVDPEREETARFNPLDGDPEVAAEVMRTVLAAMFGKQDAFFSQVQQTLTQYVVRMFKELRGNALTLPDVLAALMDPGLLRQEVDEYRQRKGDPLVIRFFETEVLGRLADKFFQFALGVRVQLGELVGNRMLRRVLTGNSDVDLDDHLARGGVLLVNTAMGRLGRLGDAFGKLVMLHIQYAVFRRPGREQGRRPHILYVDEFPRYVNEDFERMLALGRSYRCATVLSCQSTSQLVPDQKPLLREILLGNCRNKVLLNLDDAADAERFSRELGELETEDESWYYDRLWTGPIVWHVAKSKRVQTKRDPQFPPDLLLHMPRFHAVARVTVDGQPQRSILCRLELSDFDRAPGRWHRESEEKTGPYDQTGSASTPAATAVGAVELSGGEAEISDQLVLEVQKALDGKWPEALNNEDPSVRAQAVRYTFQLLRDLRGGRPEPAEVAVVLHHAQVLRSLVAQWRQQGGDQHALSFLEEQVLGQAHRARQGGAFFPEGSARDPGPSEKGPRDVDRAGHPGQLEQNQGRR